MTEPSPPSQEFHIDVETVGQDMVPFLQQHSGLQPEIIRDAINKGALWQGFKGKPKRLRKPDAKTIANTTLHLYFNPDVLSEEPIPPQLIEDLKDYSVWYKPFGMRSQGSRWGDHCTLYHWAETHLEPPRPAYIVHRLDRAATGLMLIAHSKQATAKLTELFQQRKVDKRYHCIVHGKFPTKPEERRIEKEIDGKAAVSFARRLEFDPVTKRSLLEVRIETGRKHQIRRHLSELGFPVVGDRLYGREGDGEDLMLTAVSLEFVCPLRGWKRTIELQQQLRPILTPNKQS